MRKKINKKKIIITTASTLVVAAIAIGGFFLFRSKNADPVDVYSVEMLNSSGWYEEQSELSGTITSDFIQEVYQDTSQQIKKVYVKEGDKVKVGDKLLKYNVDEKELDLKLQKLQIQSSKFQIEKMEKELEKLKNTKAVGAVDGNPNVVNASANLSLLSAANLVELSDGKNAGVSENAGEGFNVKEAPEATTQEPPESTTATTEKPPESTTEEPPEATTEEPPEATTEEPEPDPEYNISISFADGQSRKTVSAGKSYKLKATVTGDVPSGKKIEWILMNQESEASSIQGSGKTATLTVSSDETAETLDITAIIGGASDTLIVDVKQSSSSDPIEDPSNGGNGGGDPIGNGGGGGGGGGDSDEQTYTADELKDAISEKEADIAKAKQELGEAKISYKEAKKEVSEATIKATVKGTVTTAYTKKSAPSDGSPMIVVKAEDGIYVNTEVSELNLDTVQVGGTITCTSWETNESYEAKVISVADYPTSGTNNEGMANPNSSYYKVVAFIEDAGTLTTGQSVNVTYSAQSMGTSSEDTICLQKAYVRTEDSQSYVYKKGNNGRLEKQYIKTGKTIFGQYIEVLEGIDWEDQIAFPYGKNVKEGAKTQLNENMDSIIY